MTYFDCHDRIYNVVSLDFCKGGYVHLLAIGLIMSTYSCNCLKKLQSATANSSSFYDVFKRRVEIPVLGYWLTIEPSL